MLKRLCAMFLCFTLAVLMTSIIPACAEEKEEFRTIIDMAGNEVTIPVNITKVACISATCETALVAMGQADKMVYSSTFAQGDFAFTERLFPALKETRKVKGGLTAEEMIAEGVQVVLVKSKGNVEKMQQAGIPVIYLEFNNIEQTRQSVQLLGDVFHAEEIAEQYIYYMDHYLPLISERLAEIPEEKRITVYLPLLRTSDNTIFNTYDPSHITTEVMDLCGAHIITKDIEFTDQNGIITEEALIRLNPEVIFVAGFYRDAGVEQLTCGTYDGILQAVDNHRIFYFPLGIYDWSAGGFELGISSLWCAKILYPEYFEDIDIHALAKEYYLNTAKVELTDEEIADIFHEN